MSIFPAELVLKILSYCSPRDIVRWRTVSKWFHAITLDDLLWRAMYADSRFPRPPGPSPHQSRAYLERMLVKSVQLARSWTTRPMREVASVNIKLGKPLPTTPIKLIAGRWLVGCKQARKFMLHDAEPRFQMRGGKMMIWEQEKPVVSAWDMHFVSPGKGQSVVYVLLELLRTEDVSLKWKLLEFRLNDESGEVCDSVTIDPPGWAQRPLSRVELQGGYSRFLYIPIETPRGVVFDTRTRAFYKVPGYRVALSETLETYLYASLSFDFRIEFTDTHIISLSYCDRLLYSIVTVIQLFAIPSDEPPDQEGPPLLRLTHEGISNKHILNVTAMKPCIDPITGDTSIRLFNCRTLDKSFEILVVDLTLPKSPGSKATRMTVHTRQRKWTSQEGMKSDLYPESCVYFDVCDGKRLRGFCRTKPKRKLFQPVESQHIMKFSIDMTQRPLVVRYGQLSSAQWRDAADAKVDETGRSITFDGLRGRLCYVHPRVKDKVIVVEIK